MLFLKSSTQSLRFGRSLQRTRNVDQASTHGIVDDVTVNLIRPVLLDLVVMDCLGVVRVDIKLRQRQLARVEVFQLDRHRAVMHARYR